MNATTRLARLRARRPGAAALIVLAVLASARSDVIAKGSRAVSMIDRLHIIVRAEGNELIARRRAPVLYTTLEQGAREIANSKPATAAAIRVVRSSPMQMVEYLVGVTSGGVLILGEQTRRFDFGERRYIFVSGEIARAYPALDRPGPWTWLLDIPVSRETSASLEVRADGSAWPLETVEIAPVRLP